MRGCKAAEELPLFENYEKLEQSSLYDGAIARIRSLIVRGILKPGEQIVEADLSNRLGISRTPVREAVKLLSTEGLVLLRRNRSPIVAPFDRQEILELFQVVSSLERLGAEQAAASMTDIELKKLRDIQLKMESHHSNENMEEYFGLNQQIHALIMDCSRNKVLKLTHESLMARVERARFFALSVEGRWDESIQEHRELLDYLAAGDPEKAGKCLADHVLRTGEIVVAAIEKRQDI